MKNKMNFLTDITSNDPDQSSLPPTTADNETLNEIKKRFKI